MAVPASARNMKKAVSLLELKPGNICRARKPLIAA
jgi:hypothetical protein